VDGVLSFTRFNLAAAYLVYRVPSHIQNMLVR